MNSFEGTIRFGADYKINNLIWNDAKSMAILFDGEIYNSIDLKNTIKNEKTNCNFEKYSQIVLAGIENFGIDFISKIEGVFSICVYFQNENKWIFARDKFGTKPFYYFADKSNFVFGSQLKQILQTGLAPKIIDREALSYYFQLTYIPAPYSICQNVRKLLPGSYLIVADSGNIEEKRYFQINPHTKEEYLNYDICKKELRERLFDSVQKRMISGSSMGAFLSGGFDSTIVVGVMSQLSEKPIDTFTVGFEDKAFDETELAGIVAKKNQTKHNVLNLNWQEAEICINELLNDIDEPYADSSLIAAYAISKMTKKHVDLALTGDAGDELFAGYNKYLIGYYTEKYNRIPSFVRNGLMKPAIKLIPRTTAIYRKVNKVIQNSDKDIFEQRIGTMSLGFKYDETQKLFQNGVSSKLDFIKPIYDMYSDIDEQTKAQFLDMNVVLEGDMLPKIERAGRLSNFGTRAPLLDSNIVELAFGMPSNFKIDGKRRKIILKDSFADLIPEELFRAKKKGFSVPIGSWIENNLKENILRFADKAYLEKQDLFSPEYINTIIDNHFSHKENRFSELWAFYVFQNWYEKEWKA